MKNRIVLPLLMLLIASASFGQNVLDGVYVKESNPARRVVPYSYLREADVMWSKKIWRHIDLNEKMNAPFRYPKATKRVLVRLARFADYLALAGIAVHFSNPLQVF